VPPESWLGFGASDFIELALAAFLIALAFISRPWIEPLARKLAPKTGWSMLVLALVPLLLRLAMLPRHGVPVPGVYDEFGHLLVADTLLHFRLANPPHPLHQFFETFFVLQTPSYASIYPVGEGLTLAIGRAIFGLPWAGVLITTAAMCALCYWMLRGWMAPEWALLGGLLCAIEFGPLNAWMNSYWGGAAVGCAGCLVFGALPRLRGSPKSLMGMLLGLGIGISWLVRPYETIFLIFSALLLLAPSWRSVTRPATAAMLAFLPFAGISLLQNQQVTGSWTTTPYQLSRSQYGVPAAFTWQPNPQPHNQLTREQQLQYKMQTSFRAAGPETMQSYFQRLEYRVRFYRFFFLAPLYVALPFSLVKLREPRFLWLAVTLATFALGVNFYPFFEVHYLGALTCLFVLVSVTALQQLPGQASHWIVYLCLAHFVFFYARSFFEPAKLSPRTAVVRQLSQAPGNQLVFVRYSPQHIFQNEWVYNAADIDRARIVWARDLGVEDEKLLHYYPNRTAWLLDADAIPLVLTHYVAPVANQPTSGKPKANPPKAKQPPLRFEQVH